MDAKQLFTLLQSSYTNCYFGSYEELNVILDNATFPCAVVVPVSKQVQYIADRFRVVETVVVASLTKMELDFQTSAIYDVIKTSEQKLLKAVYSKVSQIKSIQCLSELDKFDANVAFACFSLEIVNDPICPQNA